MRRSYAQKDGKSKTRGCFALDAEQAAAVERTVSTWRVVNAERQGEGQHTAAAGGGSRITLEPSGM